MVQWTTEADKAFRRMKELLEALPTVTAPIKGETLIIYLAALEESISVVLMAERGKKQVPVYFVLSDKPIKQILARPEKSGRIAKWAIELGEHEIEFRGSNLVKGQILADFLAETPLKEKEGAKDEEAKRKEPELGKAWKLFTDGASSSDRSRAGLILVSPEGKEYTYALRFEFETTNNEAEYEALLAGLRITKEMKVQELTIFLDSQLVANQVNRLFEARQTIIKQYLEKAKKLLVNFPCHSIEHIKRDQNKKADALSKMASMTFFKLAKEVLVEVIQDKSIT
ncbi:reverse transcriptase domain-containing protein [Tanacetum coccineum]